MEVNNLLILLSTYSFNQLKLPDDLNMIAFLAVTPKQQMNKQREGARPQIGQRKKGNNGKARDVMVPLTDQGTRKMKERESLKQGWQSDCKSCMEKDIKGGRWGHKK